MDTYQLCTNARLAAYLHVTCLDIIKHTLLPCWCSRAVAYRFGQYLDAAVPLVLRFSKGASDGDEELSESCLQVRVRGWKGSPHGTACAENGLDSLRTSPCCPRQLPSFAACRTSYKGFMPPDYRSIEVCSPGSDPGL